jgi:hypothetical protein
LREGDTLLVTKIDRLARSTSDLYRIVSELAEKEVAFRVTDDRAVAVFDYGWTEEQAKGLFDSLNLTGGEAVRQSSNRRLE